MDSSSENIDLAEKNLREVLMQNGFGVITEIDIKESFRKLVLIY